MNDEQPGAKPEEGGTPRAGRGPEDAGTRRGGVAPDAAALRLGMLLQLLHRVRSASERERQFIIVNETRQLIPYRQAALWIQEGGKPVLKALSGVALLDGNSPFVRWLGRLGMWRIEQMRRGTDEAAKDAVSLGELASDEAPKWLGEWREWVPEHAVFLPLYGPGNWLCGLLCLFRREAFAENESRLLSHLAEGYGDIVGGALMRPRRLAVGWSLWRIIAVAAAAAFMILMFVPVQQSALAPAEVAARTPAIVRAEVDGVVDRFLIEPNQLVKKGEPLFRLDDTQLRTRHAIAEKAEEMARIELRQMQQLVLSDPKSKSRLPLLQVRLEQLSSETAYIRSLLERVTTVSPIDGVALVDNPEEWLGRPVSLGQRIMTVADPENVSLDIYLPVTDAMRVESGSRLRFFPNVAPGSPLEATVYFISYRAIEAPGVGMAFLLRARIDDSNRPMLGLRGTARLTGEPLPLGLSLVRRPFMAVRQWLGW